MDFSKLLQDEATMQWTKDIIAKLAPYPYLADIIVLLLALVIGSIFFSLLFFILHRILLRFYRRHCELSSELLSCIRKMTLFAASCLPTYLICYCIWVDGIHEWVALLSSKLLWGVFLFFLTMALTYGIRSFGLWYKQQRNAEQRPIDGLLVVSIFFVWTGAIIILVSILLNKSPLYLLSGLGAIAAILLLLFQQSILSLIASIQVNAEHLIELGDWIAMDSNNVDGTVCEITLHTVKVRNWDKTLVCMPVCDLVNKSFVNYTAMQRTGGRRIKRSILIDQRSIRFLSEEEVKSLKGFDILKDYLEDKETEISCYNTGRSRFNTRYLTNLGTFRVYAQHYLEQNPNIRNDMMLTVRELAPTSQGVPLEIYCFSKEVNFRPFEQVQSDIMEHLLAILPNFRLRVFQDCSDIYQEIGNQVDMVGGAFRFDQLKNPVYPDNSGNGSI